MSKKSKIRWRESDLAELKRTIKNFNAKIKYHTKKNPSNKEYLPELREFNKVIDSIETRADYNRVVNSLKRFSKRGAETIEKSERGAKFSTWEKQERLLQQRWDNARKTRELKKIRDEEVKIGGKSTGQKRAEMGKINEVSLLPSHKNPDKMSQKEWDLFRKNLDSKLNANLRNEKKEKMRENYIKGLTEGGFLDASPELEKYIRGVDIDTFIQTVETDETADFLWYKDPAEWEVRLEYMLKSWEKAYNG